MELCFNSRTPGGVRLLKASAAMLTPLFQFTHPGRGATDVPSDDDVDFPVSIHAPREGCDAYPKDERYHTHTFQFTHPGRGATYKRSPTSEEHLVSIHAPREGCDCSRSVLTASEVSVSIHAPREGCDTGVVPSELFGTEFQFTHPGRGATEADRLKQLIQRSFNSRTPGGVRLIGSLATIKADRVSIHAPREGCDVSGISSKS